MGKNLKDTLRDKEAELNLQYITELINIVGTIAEMFDNVRHNLEMDEPEKAKEKLETALKMVSGLGDIVDGVSNPRRK